LEAFLPGLEIILQQLALKKILFSHLKIFQIQFNLLVILLVKDMLKNTYCWDNKLNKKIIPGLPSKN